MLFSLSSLESRSVKGHNAPHDHLADIWRNYLVLYAPTVEVKDQRNSVLSNEAALSQALLD